MCLCVRARARACVGAWRKLKRGRVPEEETTDDAVSPPISLIDRFYVRGALLSLSLSLFMLLKEGRVDLGLLMKERERESVGKV